MFKNKKILYEFKNKLKNINSVHSMSRVARYIDNGPMEKFYWILKSEIYYLSKFYTYEDLEQANNRVDFKTATRLLGHEV